MIRFFTHHPTAANLLMLIFLAAGILSAPRILRETQPAFAATEVEVRANYPGAAAEEIENTVCRRIEDAVDGVTFVKEVRSDARRNLASVRVEMDPAGDIQTFLNDIKREVDAIDDFPSEVEEPVVSEVGRTDPVLSLLVSGPMSTADLKTYSEGLKDRLRESGISLVRIEGFSQRQLRVSLAKNRLRELGLSAHQVGERISARNQDLPLGDIEEMDRKILLRFLDQRHTAEGLEELIIHTGEQGGVVRLGEIADIEDHFEIEEDKIKRKGRRHALLRIEKTKAQDSIRVGEQVKDFLESESRRYPQVDIIVTRDETEILKDRLNMLIVNGIQGLALVFLTLWFFFNIRISFWVAVGLPVSFLGVFIVMPFIGLSINMFTMVGMLMALGLLMDDAIVIAENIMAYRQKGEAPLEAAVHGVKEVAAGVFASFITTVCILGPLAFIEGQIGRVLRVVPMMLILVLAVSLIEAFWILPAHLNHAMHCFDWSSTNRFRKSIDGAFEWIRGKLFGEGIKILLRWRYLVVSCVIGIFILSIGMVTSGHLKIEGMPELEGDVVVARLLMTPGTSLSRTEAAVEELLEALERVNRKFKPYQPDEQDLVVNTYVQYNLNTEAFDSGPHVATITADLLTAEERTGTVEEYIADWRKETGAIPDMLDLSLSEPGLGPAGRPIEVRLRGENLNLMKEAVTDMENWFGRFTGVVNLSGDLRQGAAEAHLRVKDGAYSLGMDASNIASQLRAAYQGMKVDNIQVRGESYEIEVRFRDEDRAVLEELDNFNLVAPDGSQVPLSSLATWQLDRGWARIARHNGMRSVTLRGDVDTRLLNTNELINTFQNDYKKDFKAKYPELKLEISGSVEETSIVRMSMLKAMGLGLIGVFILLSFEFRTYTEPVIVMLAIPFAMIGVIWGHIIMGVPISMPSLLGFIALSGIVVNDSILLVIFLKNARKQGLSIYEAAAGASRMRFRAVLLTSTTTIAGVLPLMLEKSLQAQMLQPLVISTAFGLMASTAMVLLVLPCMYLILADLGLVERIDRD